MKKIKFITILTISFTFSSCLFLDYMIPEEYQHETTLFDENDNRGEFRYLWISHPVGIQCKGNYFESLEDAEIYLQKFNVEIYDTFEGITSQQEKCGFPTDLRYYVKIEIYDYEKAKALGWWEAKKPDNDTKR